MKKITILGIVLSGLFLTACSATGNVEKGESSSYKTEKTNEAKSEKLTEEQQDQFILDEYSKKITDATPGLIDEYNAEATSNAYGLEGLATISNSKVSKLAEISTEGMSKMAEVMMSNGSGKQDTYNEFSKKMTDVYTTEAAKITEAYTSSAQ